MQNTFKGRSCAEVDADASLSELWHKFNSEFSSEEKCFEVLLAKYNDQSIKCNFCTSEEIERAHGARTGKCLSCKKTVWCTAGTFFHRMRKARPWLAAIWLMERGQGLSAGLLHRLVDVATSTAWLILKKIHLVITAKLETQSKVVSVPSANFNSIICKRSTETPAGSHPVTEQLKMEKRDSKVDSSSVESEPNLAESLIFIRKNFHGSSRKYLQFFLAAYWCKTDRESWSEWSLLQACRNSRKICLEEILSCTSPFQLNMMLPQPEPG